MIPKRIIYCWFGGKEKPQKVVDCINSWKKAMPDWEYLEINESSFDINYNEYVREAYDNKKWAYVSDVARLWALYKYGGIYMDTDVQVYKPLDRFLEFDFFTGFEQPHYPVTATMGAIKENKLIKEMLDQYESETFKTHKDWKEYKTNTMIMSDVLEKYFDRDSMVYQAVDNMAIFPKETFCNGEIDENTYTRHLMFGSWL
jgi:mannosyltransferase OCH1-like enzyme